MSLNQQVAGGSLSPVEKTGPDWYNQFLQDQLGKGTITGQEAQQEGDQLRAELQEIVNKDQVKAEADTNVAAAAQRRLEAGKFWSTFLTSPEKALEEQIDKAFPGDSMASGIAKDLFRGLKSGMFDPESSLAAYGNSQILDAYSGPATIAGGGGGMPVASKSLLASGKVADGPTPCSRSVVVGTVTGVARMVTGFASDRLRSISSAHQTVASMGAAYPDLVSFLMTLPMGALNTLLTDKVALLDQIIGLTNKTLEITKALKADDYGYDHRSAINNARTELRTAVGDLSDVERVLLAGGNFLSTVWDRAEGNVQDAIDILRDTDLDLQPGGKQMQLISLLSSLNTSTQVLICRESFISQIYRNLSIFPSSFRAFGRFDNLFGPILDQVKCLLNTIIREMEAMLSRGLTSQFYVKEQKWYIELQGVLQFMRGVAGLSSRIGSSPSVQQFSTDLLESTEELNSAYDFSALLNLVDAFVSAVRAVIFVPVENTASIENLALTIVAECERQKLNVSEIDQKLVSFRGSFGSDFTEAVTVANGLVSFLESKDLIGMAQSLKKGDVRGFFEAANNEQTLEESAINRVVKLIQYAKTNKKGEVASLVSTYTELRGRVRADDLFRKLTTRSANLFVRDIKEKRIPANNRMLKGINRFNSAIKTVEQKAQAIDKRIAQVKGKIDTVINKIGEGQKRVEGVVAKITQRKPVSCAAR